MNTSNLNFGIKLNITIGMLIFSAFIATSLALLIAYQASNTTTTVQSELYPIEKLGKQTEELIEDEFHLLKSMVEHPNKTSHDRLIELRKSSAAAFRLLEKASRNQALLHADLEKIRMDWKHLTRLGKESLANPISPTFSTDLKRHENIILKSFHNLLEKNQRQIMQMVLRLNESIDKTIRFYFPAAFFLLLFSVIVAFRFRSATIKPMYSLLDSINRLSKASYQTYRDVSISSGEIAEACSKQSSAVQETVSAMGEMSSMVFQTSEKAEHSGNIAKEVSNSADQSRETLDKMLQYVSKLVNAMQDIRKESSLVQNSTSEHLNRTLSVIDEIADKTTVINDIVQKTQLLSFNASIEAARAGQHGRGFAVVAHEVGNLARMSGQASKAIDALIVNSKEQIANIIADTKKNVSKAQQTVDEGISISTEANEITNQTRIVLGEIISQIQEITHQVETVKEAAVEQRQGLEQISSSMNLIDQTTRNLLDSSVNNEELSIRISLHHQLVQEISNVFYQIVKGHSGQQDFSSSGSQKPDKPDNPAPTPRKTKQKPDKIQRSLEHEKNSIYQTLIASEENPPTNREQPKNAA